MKKHILYSIATILMLTSCVQKTKTQTVTLLLDVASVKDIKTVGVRGVEKPFSWDYDMEMEVVKKDSLYKKTFVTETGCLYTEIKFTINGNFELQNKENRKIYFSNTKTTIIKSKFDVSQ
ncbi:MAG: hypothetical protein H7174_00545 [Flavobacterium sp.]|nr:hypothetical protein [Flavobacterium sp.]